jgi:hypothetical protein
MNGIIGLPDMDSGRFPPNEKKFGVSADAKIWIEL